MLAAVVVPDGATGSLDIREVPDPVPAPGEVVVAVRAASVNRSDLLHRQGRYPAAPSSDPEAPDIAGLDMAGEVVALGPGVEGVAVGQRVMAMSGRAYAELVAVPAGLLLPVSDAVDWIQAAALPVALMTEYDALARAGRLAAGETVLVTAAASGVGSVGVQMARALGAGTVIGSVRSPAKAQAVRALGADKVVTAGADELSAALAEALGGESRVEVVVDHVGGGTLAAHLQSMAVGGRLVSVGRLGGRTAELDMNLLALKRLHLVGATFRTRTVADRIAIAEGVREHVLPAVADGRIRAVVDRCHPWRSALAAQEEMRQAGHTGKIILAMPGA
ncbi:zinc-binding dehydrogenase [Streptomyces sp. NPDC002577]